MKILPRTQFGNPILRKKSRQLSKTEIVSPAIQELIKNMRYTLVEKKLGIGLAAPQVGKSIALAVIAIRPLPHRPNVKAFDLVLINPVVTEFIGAKASRWEGCISAGSKGEADLFAKVSRCSEVKVKYVNESGELCYKNFKGLKAHVIQHEIDHVNGVLFVDRIEDTKTFMTYKEYMRRVKKLPVPSQANNKRI
jgi:peptide deformylase